MTFLPEIRLGDLISAASFLVAAIALFLALYQLRRDAIRNQAQLSALALTSQLNALIQIQGMPDDRRDAVWNAIASREEGPGHTSPIEKAIAIQIGILDRIAQGKLITTIPTYGLMK